MSWDSNVLPAIVDNIASEYAEYLTYHQGDIVYYNQSLYRCEQEETSGAFNASNWQPIQLANEVYKVKQMSLTPDNSWGRLPVLMADYTDSSVAYTFFDTDVTINPSNGQLNATQYTVNNSIITVTKTSSGGWLWS